MKNKTLGISKEGVLGITLDLLDEMLIGLPRYIQYL